MSSIQSELIALDTNVYAFGIARDAAHPACQRLLFEEIHRIGLFVPYRVIAEIHRILPPEALAMFYDILDAARESLTDYSTPRPTLIERYRNLGAKKGDIVIAAHLHAAGIRWLVSENRHFLYEIPNLPFKVITAR